VDTARLEQWAENGWLRSHRTTAQEIRELFMAADEDLTSAAVDPSVAWRFNKGYTAAFRMCSAALYAAGYEASRGDHHYRTIDALPLVIGSALHDLSNYLHTCSTKRHDVTYESVHVVSKDEADEILRVAAELRDSVREWLRQNHPTLVP
jgi:uncharacterized protein (UPF0332 family)